MYADCDFTRQAAVILTVSGCSQKRHVRACLKSLAMSVFDEGAVPFSSIPAPEIPWHQGYRFANRCFLTGHGNFQTTSQAMKSFSFDVADFIECKLHLAMALIGIMKWHSVYGTLGFLVRGIS